MFLTECICYDFFYPDSLFSSQGELLSTRVLRWTKESLYNIWFIDIALKLGAQLSISITIFQGFGMTWLWIELTTSRSDGFFQSRYSRHLGVPQNMHQG